MKLNRFIVNSDYTAEKQKLDFTLTLPSSSITVSGGGMGTRYVDYTVPAGVYFENVLWQTSLTGASRYSGPFLEFEPSDQLSVITFTVDQRTPTTYRLTATVANWDTSSHSYSFSATAKVHLSVAPF